MSTVAITLPEDLEVFVHSMVESGRYHGPNELVANAIYALKDHLELERLKISRLQADIQSGLDDIEQGQVVEDWSLENFFKERHQAHGLA